MVKSLLFSFPLYSLIVIRTRLNVKKAKPWISWILSATKSLYRYCLPPNPCTVIVCHQIPVRLLSATKSLYRYCLPLNSCTIIVLPPNPCTVIVLPPNPCTVIVCHQIPVPLHYSSLVLGSSRARDMYSILTQYIILYSPHLSPFLWNYWLTFCCSTFLTFQWVN